MHSSFYQVAITDLIFHSHDKDGQRLQLPDKPTDFQVRVHILEARKLVASNPSPTVKVACGKHIQQTSTQKGTNNPTFDEVSTRTKFAYYVYILFKRPHTIYMTDCSSLC